MNSNIKYFQKSIGNEIFTSSKLLIKTYLLLSSTILFSAFISFLSIYFNAKPIGFFSMLISYFLILFLINIFKKSFLGLVFVFLLTGFLGYCVGPFISSFLSFKNGANVVFLALFMTGLIFFLLSIYTVISKKNFSFLSSFLFVGFFIIIFGCIFNLFFYIKLFNLVLSGLVVIFSSAFILYDLSSIIHCDDIDYVSVTISLYLSVYNIFVNLLNILFNSE